MRAAIVRDHSNERHGTRVANAQAAPVIAVEGALKKTKRTNHETKVLLSVAAGVAAVTVIACGSEVMMAPEESASATASQGTGGAAGSMPSTSSMCCTNSVVTVVGAGGGLGGQGSLAGGGSLGGAGGM